VKDKATLLRFKLLQRREIATDFVLVPAVEYMWQVTTGSEFRDLLSLLNLLSAATATCCTLNLAT
jgi:hypothetical protein